MIFLNQNLSQTKQLYPLHNNKIVKKTINRSLSYFITVLLWGIFIFFFVNKFLVDKINTELLLTILWSYPLFSLFYIILVYFYELAYFYNYYYDIKEDRVVIKKGVFNQEEVNIPFEKIQDVYVDQDILDRILGLYDVHISSATILSAILAHIDGVDKKSAEGLKNLLLEKIRNKFNQQNLINFSNN